MSAIAPSVNVSSFEPRIEDPRWSEALPGLDDLLTRVMIAAMLETGAAGSGDLLFTNDTEMQALNRQWRGLDKPTDVLSFPSEGPGEPDAPPHLGDIALGFETAMRDATAMGRSFDAHVAHLVIHGFLHLLGHDHMTPDDAAVMEPLETRILANLGWPDPYSTGLYGETD